MNGKSANFLNDASLPFAAILRRHASSQQFLVIDKPRETLHSVDSARGYPGNRIIGHFSAVEPRNGQVTEREKWRGLSREIPVAWIRDRDRDEKGGRREEKGERRRRIGTRLVRETIAPTAGHNRCINSNRNAGTGPRVPAICAQAARSISPGRF